MVAADYLKRGPTEIAPEFQSRIQSSTYQDLLRENRRKIKYSAHYDDDTMEYRHVIMPKAVSKFLPKNELLTEKEWRLLGIQQTAG
eukprot:gene2555-74_t